MQTADDPWHLEPVLHLADRIERRRKEKARLRPPTKPMTWTNEQAHYQAIATSIDPAAIVMTKDHPFWAASWWALVIVTLGVFALAMSKQRYLEQFATTLGPAEAFPRRWSSLDPGVIAHESAHVKQFVFCGWFVPILGWFLGRRWRAIAGFLPMLLVYGLLPFPIGLAYGRFRLELEADKAEWRYLLHSGATTLVVRDRAEARARSLSSGDYAWSWPRAWALRAYDKAASAVITQCT